MLSTRTHHKPTSALCWQRVIKTNKQQQQNWLYKTHSLLQVLHCVNICTDNKRKQESSNPDAGSGWLPKFYWNFLVRRYIREKFFKGKSDQFFQRYEPNCENALSRNIGQSFMKIGSAVLREVLSWQANNEKDRNTDKRRVKHNLLGGGN